MSCSSAVTVQSESSHLKAELVEPRAFAIAMAPAHAAD